MTKSHASYAVFALLSAMLLNATTDVLVKWLAVNHSILQIIFFRNLFSLIPVAAVVARNGGLPSLRSNHVPLNILRALFGLASMVLYVISFTLMPLANVIAIGFVAPLILVVLCRIFLRELVSVEQWAAVAGGCCGALIIVQPDYEVLQWRALLPVAGAFFLAVYMLLLRILSRTETRSSLIVYFPVVSIICTGAALPWVATTPDRIDFLLLVITGCIGGIALYLRNEAYTAAPASVLAPCEYTGLLWVAIFGVAVFGDNLSRQLFIGATLLIATNLFVLLRVSTLSSQKAT
jgi:drug/metabolite transporter (DMT)-like permease